MIALNIDQPSGDQEFTSLDALKKYWEGRIVKSLSPGILKEKLVKQIASLNLSDSTSGRIREVALLLRDHLKSARERPPFILDQKERASARVRTLLDFSPFSLDEGKKISCEAEEISCIAKDLKSAGLQADLLHRLDQIVSKIEKMPVSSKEARALLGQFTQLFSDDKDPSIEKVRQLFASRVYQAYEAREVHWNVPQKTEDRQIYFHATTLHGIKGILQSQKIIVTHKRAYEGAFVSTKPEKFFGEFVLVFNRKIEFSAPIARSGCMGEKKYKETPHCWIGFKDSIPVNADTLECIAIGCAKDDLPRWKVEFSITAGREINVIALDELEMRTIERSHREGVVIPKGWPKDVGLRPPGE